MEFAHFSLNADSNACHDSPVSPLNLGSVAVWLMYNLFTAISSLDSVTASRSSGQIVIITILIVLVKKIFLDLNDLNLHVTRFFIRLQVAQLKRINLELLLNPV